MPGTFAPYVMSLHDPRFTANEAVEIEEALERAFYDAGGFENRTEYAARTALPIVLALIAKEREVPTPSPAAPFEGA